MKLFALPLSLLFALALLVQANAQMWSVEVFDGNAMGMGSIVSVGDADSRGYCNVIVATAAHVVESSSGIRIKLETGKSYNGGAVIGRNSRCDLAVVRIRMKREGLEAVEVSDKAAEEGDKLEYVGRFRRKFSGQVSCLVYGHELWCDVVVFPGDSGGAVLLDGKLVGCVSGGLLWSDNSPQRTWPCRSNNLNPLKELISKSVTKTSADSTSLFKDYERGDLKTKGMLQVVMFTADWCGPCQSAKAEMKRKEKKIASYGVKRIVLIDVDKHTDLVKSNKVKVYPTMLLVRDGKVLKRVEGASVNDLLTKLHSVAE